MNHILSLAKTNHSLHRFRFLIWLTQAIVLAFIIWAMMTGESTTQTRIFGLVFIVLPIALALDIFSLYVREEIDLSRTKNLPGELTFEAASIIVQCQTNSAKLWYFLINEKSVRFMLARLGVNARNLVNLKIQLPSFNDWRAAATTMAKVSSKSVSPFFLFEAIATTPELIQIWQSDGITQVDRKEVNQWYQREIDSLAKSQSSMLATLEGSTGIGRDWTSGYTHALEQYAEDITRDAERYSQQFAIVGHTEERRELVDYLSRPEKHHALLVGEEGVGKERIINALAIDLVRGRVPSVLKYHRLMELDTGSLVSGADQATVEQRLTAVFNEAATTGNIILFMPKLSLLLSASNNQKLGTVDASAILSRYLNAPEMRIVGAITQEEYNRSFQPNLELTEAIPVVRVNEIGARESLEILEDEIFTIERQTKAFFTYQALTRIVTIADERVHNQPFPEKALALTNEVAGDLNHAGDKADLVTAASVDTILSKVLKMPLGQASGQESELLTNLEAKLAERIIGQKEAVAVVANALRRARSGVNSGHRPIGSYLFLGPTGVGKTEMAKTIAAVYYQNEAAFIRLDMTEYQGADAIGKLIGTSSAPGTLTAAITNQPFSVILLDEIEKASQEVRNIFLQILDDGRVTDGYGRLVDFTNSMVIATSNAGAEIIRETAATGQLPANFSHQLLNQLLEKQVFSPEWVNRFDSVVVFLPLTRDEIKQIAKLQITQLSGDLAKRNITLTLDDDIYDFLAERGYDPEFGARPMRRAIQDTVEVVLAKDLLENSDPGPKNIHLTRSNLQGMQINTSVVKPPVTS